MINQEKSPDIAINTCFLKLSGLKNKFEPAVLNEPLVFELLKFDCKYGKYLFWLLP